VTTDIDALTTSGAAEELAVVQALTATLAAGMEATTTSVVLEASVVVLAAVTMDKHVSRDDAWSLARLYVLLARLAAEASGAVVHHAEDPAPTATLAAIVPPEAANTSATQGQVAVGTAAVRPDRNVLMASAWLLGYISAQMGIFVRIASGAAEIVAVGQATAESPAAGALHEIKNSNATQGSSAAETVVARLIRSAAMVNVLHLELIAGKLLTQAHLNKSNLYSPLDNHLCSNGQWCCGNSVSNQLRDFALISVRTCLRCEKIVRRSW
jgi:hypothetical protein